MEAGRKLLHYRLVEKLGAGGMGEVYVAEDTTLNRKVALKVLPPEMASEERRMRFEREARLLASLNHTNIATIHGLEEHEGVHFLVLELVPGETLAEHVARGPLSMDDALALLTQ